MLKILSMFTLTKDNISVIKSCMAQKVDQGNAPNILNLDPFMHKKCPLEKELACYRAGVVELLLDDGHVREVYNIVYVVFCMILFY